MGGSTLIVCATRREELTEHGHHVSQCRNRVIAQGALEQTQVDDVVCMLEAGRHFLRDVELVDGAVLGPQSPRRALCEVLVEAVNRQILGQLELRRPDAVPTQSVFTPREDQIFIRHLRGNLCIPGSTSDVGDLDVGPSREIDVRVQGEAKRVVPEKVLSVKPSHAVRYDGSSDERAGLAHLRDEAVSRSRR